MKSKLMLIVVAGILLGIAAFHDVPNVEKYTLRKGSVEALNQAMGFLHNGFFQRGPVNNPETEYTLSYMPPPPKGWPS